MKQIVLIITGLLAAWGAPAQTNVKLAVEAGLSMSNVKRELMDTDPNTYEASFVRRNADVIFGPRTGAVLSLELSDKLALQPGLFYNRKGYRHHETNNMHDTVNGAATVLDQDVTTSINYLDLPVNIAYRIGSPGRSFSFMVYGGPYAAYAFSGRVKKKGMQTTVAPGGAPQTHSAQETNMPLRIGRDGFAYTASGFRPADELKPFDFGFQMGAGCEAKQGLYIKMQYQMGLANLSNDDFFYTSGTNPIAAPQFRKGYLSTWSLSFSIGYFILKGNRG